jgi:hypothetical protein
LSLFPFTRLLIFYLSAKLILMRVFFLWSKLTICLNSCDVLKVFSLVLSLFFSCFFFSLSLLLRLALPSLFFFSLLFFRLIFFPSLREAKKFSSISIRKEVDENGKIRCNWKENRGFVREKKKDYKNIMKNNGNVKTYARKHNSKNRRFTVNHFRKRNSCPSQGDEKGSPIKQYNFVNFTPYFPMDFFLFLLSGLSLLVVLFLICFFFFIFTSKIFSKKYISHGVFPL